MGVSQGGMEGLKVSSNTAMGSVGGGFGCLILLLVFGTVYVEYLQAQNQEYWNVMIGFVLIGVIISTIMLIFVINIDPSEQTTKDNWNDN